MPRVSRPPRGSSGAVARAAAVVAILLFAVMLGGCGREIRPAEDTYVVRAGDTLYSIARRRGLDYRDVARWNGIGRDYAIVPGQVLVLAPGRRGDAGDARTAAASPSGSRSPRADSPPATVGPAPEPPLGTLPWTWPTDGRVAGPVSRPSGGVGLRIDGVEGQEVRAAAPGRVVYVGGGLRAYGQLVIVKHDEAFLTAYGHNAALLVREGEDVRAGQPIARMGLGPGNVPMLYFEIRWNGRPVDPRPFLPPR
jgi:lipoprotein NlpD